jgi:integrase
MVKLSDALARALDRSDKPVCDDAVSGLYLFPAKSKGNGKWIFRYVSPLTGKRRDMGLGAYPSVSIRNARLKTIELRGVIDDGSDPLEVRRALEGDQRLRLATPTFEEAARKVHKSISAGFRNAKHIDQWINTLEDYVFPKLGRIRVSELRPAHFADVLEPIWLSKPETASRVRQRCDAAMKWCAAQGFIVASPVAVVQKLLPKQPGKRELVEHHPAVPWREIPALFQSLLSEARLSQGRQMLELLILTATRSGEVRGITWDEVDLNAKVWIIPGIRMKAKVAHRIPLGPRAVTLLSQLKHSRNPSQPLVFSSRNGTTCSDMVITKMLRDAKVSSDVSGRIATAHGFRSSFRDWASEQGYSRDLAERALAHTIRDATEAAYHRTDLLEQRREMMEAWEKWCFDASRPGHDPL